MISTIQVLMKPFFIAVALTACLPIAASRAQTAFAYVSATGSGNACTATQPCSSLNAAINAALTNNSNNGQIVCLGSVNLSSPSTATGIGRDDQTLKIDCPAGAYLTGLVWGGSNETAKFRNVTFTNLGLTSAIRFTGSGTLILESCIFEESHCDRPRRRAERSIEPCDQKQPDIERRRCGNTSQTGRWREHQCDIRSCHGNR